MVEKTVPAPMKPCSVSVVPNHRPRPRSCHASIFADPATINTVPLQMFWHSNGASYSTIGSKNILIQTEKEEGL